MNTAPHLFLFREDLRLADNPALRRAVDAGRPLILLYVYDDVSDGAWAVGGARKWWLHYSLIALAKDIKAAGGRLDILMGTQNETVLDAVTKHNVEHVYWTRRYAPYQIAQDKDLKASLGEKGVDVTSLNGRLLFEPWAFQTGSGGTYKVFSPFWRALQARGIVRDEVANVEAITPFAAPLDGVCLDDLALLPSKPNWAKGFATHWQAGEDGAADRLGRFLDDAVSNYKDERNRPDKVGTSGLSPHLHHGEISPVQIWHAVQDRIARDDIPEKQAMVFLSEVTWREFSYVLLYDNPDMLSEEIKAQFKHFPWGQDEAHFSAWCQGQTGYPIVDAGMRQLWQTGWMHNRVRMIVGSFLVKHLLLDWRDGMAWFWDTLVDADIGANTASWQWIAGCGADAAPYFRVFNPILQGDKFDPNGDYVRKYVPEIAKLPQKYLNKPWEAPNHVLATAGITLGVTYPKPIVEHKRARERALEAYEGIKIG